MNQNMDQKQKTKLSAKYIRGVILMAGIILLVLGISQNGHTDIRNKAIRICYECIGIG